MTTILLIVPDFAGILGNLPTWTLVHDNILPFQSFSYHGTLLFVPLYMVLSGLPTVRVSATSGKPRSSSSSPPSSRSR
ncbi:MAG: hypothetical protein MZW92_12370 [Comamonadaceae bacterium]|nr:hypothetical protein [Comamonadaceae bacterium]